MPEFKVAVGLSVTDYDKSYGSSLESSHHNFFVEAPDAATAIHRIRDRIKGLLLMTVDDHDRAVAEEQA